MLLKRFYCVFMNNSNSMLQKSIRIIAPWPKYTLSIEILENYYSKLKQILKHLDKYLVCAKVFANHGLFL